MVPTVFQKQISWTTFSGFCRTHKNKCSLSYLQLLVFPILLLLNDFHQNFTSLELTDFKVLPGPQDYHIQGLSSTGKCWTKTQVLSRISRTCANPVINVWPKIWYIYVSFPLKQHLLCSHAKSPFLPVI